MERDLTTERGMGQGDEHWLPCARCTVTTRHLTVLSARTVERFDRGEVVSWEKYQVVECQGCRQLSFRWSHRDTETFYCDEEAGRDELVETEELFPKRVSERRALPESRFLPFTIAALYRETLSALANGSPILAGMGMRALVEAVCAERRIKGRSLEQRIDGLVTERVLTPEGAEILHSLRLMGNLAAHEGKPPADSDLLIALDVTEHLLTSVYLLAKRAASLPSRRASSDPEF